METNAPKILKGNVRITIPPEAEKNIFHLKKPMVAISHCGGRNDRKKYGLNSVYSHHWNRDENYPDYRNHTLIYHVLNKMRPSPFSRDSKILDVGCGSGQTTAYLQENYDGEIIGMDLSEKAIDMGIKKGIKNLVVADMENPLPFPKEYFNLIISHQALFENLPLNHRKAFTNLMSYLKVGGYMAFAVDWWLNVIDIPFVPVEYESGYSTTLATGVKILESLPYCYRCILQKENDDVRTLHSPAKKTAVENGIKYSLITVDEARKLEVL